MFDTWRQQERAADVVLQPQQFVVDPQPTAGPTRDARRSGAPTGQHIRTGSGPSPCAPPSWTGSRARHAPWWRPPKPTSCRWPAPSCWGWLGAGHNPPEDAGATAERLTRELCIDLLSDSGALTTRADQAAETLLEALVALRSGRLSSRCGRPHWSIAADHEPLFDREWESMGSYQGWYAAITAFAYPENQLFPGLYVPNGLTLTPTPSYQQFLTDLRAHRITGQRARDLAAAQLGAAGRPRWPPI